MAEHLAMQIIRRFKEALIDGNTRAAGNVEIGRTTELTEVDAIDVRPGPDLVPSPYGFSTTGSIDSVQRIYVDMFTRTRQHQEDVVANVFQLRAEVHKILMAGDSKLGLPFVISIRYGGTEEFEPNFAGDRTGAMRSIWDVAYKMTYTDPTV